MVPMTTNPDALAIQVVTSASDVCVQFIFNGFVDKRLTKFSSENNVDVIFYQWITHSGNLHRRFGRWNRCEFPNFRRMGYFAPSGLVGTGTPAKGVAPRGVDFAPSGLVNTMFFQRRALPRAGRFRPFRTEKWLDENGMMILTSENRIFGCQRTDIISLPKINFTVIEVCFWSPRGAKLF